MTSLEWCHIQAQDPILSQIIREIHSKSLGKMKIKMGMPSELKTLIRKQDKINIKTWGLIQKSKSQCKNQATIGSTSIIQTKSNGGMS